MTEPHIQLVHDPIDEASLRSRIDHPDAGAQGWFVGVTRRTTGSSITESLSYEAHEAMAVRELDKLAREAIERFSLLRLVIVHRLGEVPIGQASIVVGCSSGHRPETFAALAWIMDAVKRDVPIWKRELYADGSTEWVHPAATADQATDEVGP